MRTFKDKKGREWQIDLSITTVKQVKDLVKLDLLDIAKAQPIQRLAADPVLLVDTLFVVCMAQTKELNISDEEFGRGMGGDVLDEAVTAFIEEYIDFFQRADRANLKAAWEATKKAIELTGRMIGERISKLDIEKLVQAGMSTLGTSSGNVPEQSASTPAT